MLFDLHESLMTHGFVNKYKRFLQDCILVDTGPLFLYLIGGFDEKNNTNLLALFKYSREDYQLLLKIMGLFKKSHHNFVITPHILHELIKHIQDDCKKRYSDIPKRKEITGKLASSLSPFLKEISERSTHKNDLIEHKYFLGDWEIGDISLDVIDKKEHGCAIILTGDAKITEEYQDDNKKSILVIDFNYVRNNSYLFPSD